MEALSFSITRHIQLRAASILGCNSGLTTTKKQRYYPKEAVTFNLPRVKQSQLIRPFNKLQELPAVS